MKIDRILKLVVLATLIIGCAQKSNEKKDVKSQPKIQEVVVNRIEEPTVEPRLIVKSAIASIMNREPETITVDGSDGLYFAYYQKPSDEKIYEYKFMIDGKNIMWGNKDGRWRDTKYDEKISYEETSEKLIIIQIFQDGSRIEEEFKLFE